MTASSFRSSEPGMDTISASIPAHAAATPDRDALIFECDRLSWRDLDRNLNRLATHIASQVPPEGGLALHLPNGPALVLLFFAAARAGREAQVLDPQWPAATLDTMLAALAPAHLITADARLAARHPTATLLADVAMPFADVAEAVGAPTEFTAPTTPEADQTFYVGFTSGSTGLPKGYRRSHRSWVESFRADAREFGIRGGDVVLAPGTLTHSLFLYAMANGLHAGATVVFCRQFRPDAVMRLVAEHRATVLYGVPTHLRMVLDAARGAGVAPAGNVRWVLSSGAKWFAGAAGELRHQFPAARFAEFYGASELSFVTVARDDEPVPETSVGRAFHGVTLSVRDQGGRRLPVGRVGRVFAESPFLFSGYAAGGEGDLYRADGAMSVGDIGRMDAEGFLYLIGREKRMIVTSGKNLFPEEVEHVLERHPAIAAAAVMGVSDARRGERLVAVIALAEGARASRAALIAHARAALPLYKVPRLYYRTARWPRTPSGKTDFDALRRLWENGDCAALEG